MGDNTGNCPVCRKVFLAKDIEHVLNLAGSHEPDSVCNWRLLLPRFCFHDKQTLGKNTIALVSDYAKSKDLNIYLERHATGKLVAEVEILHVQIYKFIT